MEIISSANYVKIGLILFLICTIICLLAIIFTMISEKYRHELLSDVCVIVIVASVIVGIGGLIMMSQGKTYRVKVNDEITIGEFKDAYGIEDYTVSSTSLEDVFLKLNHKITINEENIENSQNNEIVEINESFHINNAALFLPQLLSHIKRGFVSLWRNKGYSLLELLIGLFTLYIYVIIYYTVLERRTNNDNLHT